MKHKIIAFALGFIVTLGLAAPVFAANNTFQVNFLPLKNDTYDLGTTTPSNEWLHVYASIVCIQGDCRTAWPAGGSGGSGFSTTSAQYFLSVNQGPAFSTSSASYFLSQNQGPAFSTTSVDYWKTQRTFTGASTTLLIDSNTFAGLNTFSKLLTLTAASSTDLSASNSLYGPFTGGLVSFDVNKKAYSVSTTSMSASIAGNAGTATALAGNGTNCPAGFMALGVDASGNAEGCTYVFATSSPWTVSGVISLGGNGNGYTTATSSATVSSPLTGAITVVGTGQTIGIQAATAAQAGYETQNEFNYVHAATSTFSAPLVYTGSTNAVTCTVATASVPGCLAAADFTTFSGKLNLSNLFVQDIDFGNPALSTTTRLWLKNGVYASSTSQLLFASTTAISWSATSTGSNGINLSGGCFAINGACIGGTGGGSGTVAGTGSAGQIAYYTGATTVSPTSTIFINNTTGFTGFGGTTTPTVPFTFIETGLLTTPDLMIDGVQNNAGAEMALNRSSNAGAEANIDFDTNWAERWQLGIQNNGTDDFELWQGTTDAPVFTINQSSLDVNVGTTTCGNTIELCVWGDSNGGDSIFAAMTVASTSAFIVKNNGNVGINGTSSPYAKLSIASISTGDETPTIVVDAANTANGNADMAFNRANSGTAEANIDFNTAGQTFWQMGMANVATAGNDFELDDGNSNLVMTILTGKNVTGFGTSTPFWELTSATGTAPQLGLSDNNSADFAWTFRSIANNFYVATSTATATSTVADLFLNGRTGALTVNAGATSTFSAGISVTDISETGGATSTFVNGIDASGGCFSIKGVCVGSSVAGSSASSTLLIDNNTFSGATTTFAKDVWIGKTSNLPNLIIGTSTPEYGRLAGDLIDARYSGNTPALIAAFNPNAGTCAGSGFLSAGNILALASDYAFFGFTNSGWTGSGCAVGNGTERPESTIISQPTGDMNFELASTSAAVAYKWYTKNTTLSMSLNNGTGVLQQNSGLIVNAASSTITGQLHIAQASTTNLEMTEYANEFSGSDIGAKVNSAYTALPPNGGTIMIPTGTYSFSIAMNFATLDKHVHLQCTPGVRLTYTGSATSTVFNTGTNDSYAADAGMFGCDMHGPNDTMTVGIQVGGSNGAANYTFRGNHLEDFGYGIRIEGGAYIDKFENNVLEFNNRAVHIEQSNNSGENLSFIGNTISDCDTVTKCFYSDVNGSASLDLTNNSFDDSQIYIEDGNSAWTMTGGHMENPNAAVTGKYTYIVTSGGGFSNGTISGTMFANGASSNSLSPTQYIINASNLVLNNISIENYAAGKATSLVNNSGGDAHLTVTGFKNINSAVGTMATSGVAFIIDATSGDVGYVGFATSTPNWVVTALSASKPQIAMSDGKAADPLWTMRNDAGNFILSTSTYAATSTAHAMAINSAGYADFYAPYNPTAGSTFVVHSTDNAALEFRRDAFMTLKLKAQDTKDRIVFHTTGGTNDDPLYFDSDESGTTRLSIMGTGGVGVSSTTPMATLGIVGTVAVTGLTTFALGDSAICGRAGGFITFDSGVTSCIVSSQYVKHDIAGFAASDATTRIDALAPVTFAYNDGGKKDIGLIAEATAKVDSRYAQYAGSPRVMDGHAYKTGDPVAINWNAITADLVKVVQQLQTERQSATRSAEENWQWLVMAILFGLIGWQQVQIRQLRK